MSRLALLLSLLLFVMPLAALAQTAPTLAQEVGILPPAPGPHPDLEALLQRFWRDYYTVDAPNGFTMDNVRVGRVDLNDDGVEELILMIDSPAWEVGLGKPFVIATWRNKTWVAVGWGWGDADTIFSMTETVKGWHSVDTGTTIMRWNGSEYATETKNIEPVGQ